MSPVGLARERDGLPRNMLLAQGPRACQFFDDLAIAVAGFEVHVGIGSRRIPAEYPFDQAYAFEEGPPILQRQCPQAHEGVGDDVFLRKLGQFRP